jgi:hypothetical protein
MGATSARVLPSWLTEKSKDLSASDLQSRTGFSADLSLGRDSPITNPQSPIGHPQSVNLQSFNLQSLNLHSGNLRSFNPNHGAAIMVA